jgi:hypothetical protein
VIEHRQFALAPYTTTYVELDAVEFFSPDEINHETAIRLGFLIDGHHVFVVMSFDKIAKISGEALISPVAYYLGTRHVKDIPPQPFPSVPWREAYGGDYWVSKLPCLYGTGIHGLRVMAPEGTDFEEVIASASDELSDLAFENEAFWLGSLPYIKALNRGFKLSDCNGDLRHVMAVLLWLNSVPKSVKYNPVPRGAAWHKGKRVVLSAHNTVHIHLSKNTQVKQAYLRAAEKRNSPRRHDVRGHWRHRGGTLGCSHVWPIEPDEYHRFICLQCKRKRWWVHEFQRGDEAKGFIEKDYHGEL